MRGDPSGAGRGRGPASRVHVPVGDVLEGEGLLARETLKRPDGGLSSFCLFLSRAQEQLQTPDTGPVGQVEDLNGPFPSSGRRSAFQPLLFRHKVSWSLPHVSLTQLIIPFLSERFPSWPWLHKQVLFTWLPRAGQRHLA